MSLKKILGLLALVMITVFVTAFAPVAYAVSFSSPGAGSDIEQQGLFTQPGNTGYSDMDSSMNSPNDLSSQPDMSSDMAPEADQSNY
jgi:hypothetical protein